MNKSKTILVLDDDPDIGVMIKLMLEYNGYAATIADNNEKAKEILLTRDIDLIIMDMLLSGSDGTDICRHLKLDKRTSAIPILMFSAHPAAKSTCLAAGADDFISKPFEMNDMMTKIKFFLNGKNTAGLNK